MELNKKIRSDFRANEASFFEVRIEVASRPASDFNNKMVEILDHDIGWLYLIEESATLLPDKLATEWVEFYLNGTGTCETNECEQENHEGCIWNQLFEQVIDTLGEGSEYAQSLADQIFNGTIKGNQLRSTFN